MLAQLIDHLSSILISPLIFMYTYLLNDSWRVRLRVYLPVAVAIGCAAEFIRFLPIFSFLKFVIIFALDLTALCFFSAHRGKRFWFSLSTAVLFALLTSLTSRVLDPDSQIYAFLYFFLFNGLLLVLGWFFFRPVFLPVYKNAKEGWGLLCLLPCSLLLLFFSVMPDFEQHVRLPETRIMFVLFGILTAALYSVFFNFFASQSRRQTEELDNLLLRTQFTALKQQADRLRQSDEQDRIVRHDLRHYLRTLSVCLEHRDYDSAQKMLDVMASLQEKRSGEPSPENSNAPSKGGHI